jgi:hypothetical protein
MRRMTSACAKENQDLGVVKALRKPVPKLNLSPFPLPPLDKRTVFLTYHRCPYGDLATRSVSQSEETKRCLRWAIALHPTTSDRMN